MDRVATYFDVSATSQSNMSILNDDPIANLVSSSTDTSNAARDVFEANQFIMGLTHISEKAGKYWRITSTQPFRRQEITLLELRWWIKLIV